MEQEFSVSETEGEKMRRDLPVKNFIPVLPDTGKPDTALESQISQERVKNSAGFFH
jgi:hypothetical protein